MSIPQFPVDVTESRLRSFTIDELVRLHTAGKCYRAHRTLCAHCHLSVRGKDAAAWREWPDGSIEVFHAVCAHEPALAPHEAERFAHAASHLLGLFAALLVIGAAL